MSPDPRQRLIWETTQAVIAIIVTGATLYVAAVLALNSSETAAFLLLSNAFFLVIGFYFSRGIQDRRSTDRPKELDRG